VYHGLREGGREGGKEGRSEVRLFGDARGVDKGNMVVVEA